MKENSFLFPKIGLAALAVFLFVAGGCKVLYATKYTNDDVYLGISMKKVVKKYGRPYSESLYRENGRRVDVLQYKENMPYGYMLNTYFYFEDGLLVRKDQKEECPSTSNVVIKEGRTL